MENNNDIQIQFVPIELLEYNEGQIPGVPENPRTREDSKQRNLEKSIEELPEMTIARAALCYLYRGRYVVIGGNRRLEAQRALKRKEVPIIALPENTPVDKLRRIALLDNESTGQTDWTKLAKDWNKDEIRAWNIETPKGWFNEPPKRETKEDDISNLKPKQKVRFGEIWQLGNHRLMCGDSTNKDDVAKLMEGKSGRILFTSPPYSDMRDYNGEKDLSVTNISQFIESYRDYTNYQCVNLGIQRKNNEIVQYWDVYIEKARSCGYKLMSWNVWDKMMAGSIGQQKAFFPIRHEFIFIFGTEFYELNKTWDKKDDSINRKSKERKVRQADGSTKYSTIGDTSSPFKKMESVLSLVSEQGKIRSSHPAVFPVGLPGEYIKAMTDENDIVIEPFGGSGTTLIACEQLGRKCYTMELDTHYCDVIIARWEQMTGKEAVKVYG